MIRGMHAMLYSSQPQALQLRFLQTLTDVASERNSHTIVFPVPLDLIRPLMDIATAKAGQHPAPPAEAPDAAPDDVMSDVDVPEIDPELAETD